MFCRPRCFVLLMTCVVGISLAAFNGTMAQSSRSRAKSKSKSSSRKGGVKAIDAKAEKIEQQFITEAYNLSKEYADAGQLESSKKLLEAIIKLDGSLDPVKQRLKELNEAIMTSNSADLKIDISQGWTRPIANVFKGRKVRIQASGTYKVTANLTLDVNGIPKAEGKAEGRIGVNAGMPIGALMGPIVKEDGKPGKLFVIKDGIEINPKEDGQLSVRVNMPSEFKCTGQVELQLSGYVVTSKKSR